MKKVILVINAGSSSLKIAVFNTINSKIDNLLFNITIETQNELIILKLNNVKHLEYSEQPIEKINILKLMIKIFEDWWIKSCNHFTLLFTAHRFVHGGNKFTKPIIVTNTILKRLKKLINLAPLHLPYNIMALEIFQKKYLEIPHIACFDTAFHKTQPKIEKTFAIPKQYYYQGIHKYGFHGLSYQSILENFYILTKTEVPKRTIIGHLGSGCSMCAVLNNKSIATSMSFSTLDGLMMGSRCGNIDPGVLLYFLNNESMNSTTIQQLLYRNSGLLGVSGESSDVRSLLNSNSKDAQFALNLFVYKIQLEIGRLTSVLQGLDCIIFTAGIGENSPKIRKLITKKLNWLGVKIDPYKNKNNDLCISTKTSKVKVFIIHTNEELIIAKSAIKLILKI